LHGGGGVEVATTQEEQAAALPRRVRRVLWSAFSFWNNNVV